MRKKIELTVWEAILGHCLSRREIDSINKIVQKAHPNHRLAKRRKDWGIKKPKKEGRE
jgi:hypothetical protein